MVILFVDSNFWVSNLKEVLELLEYIRDNNNWKCVIKSITFRFIKEYGLKSIYQVLETIYSDKIQNRLKDKWIDSISLSDHYDYTPGESYIEISLDLFYNPNNYVIVESVWEGENIKKTAKLIDLLEYVFDIYINK